MEENVLIDFETFSEFPDKYLKVSKSSNYYFIRKQKEDFVAKRNIDSIAIINIFGKDRILIEKSYYDVNNGNLVLKIKSIKDLDGTNEEFIENENNVKVTSLDSLLNISENGVYYLSKEDIEELINYKEENAKSYGLKPRKNYI